MTLCRVGCVGCVGCVRQIRILEAALVRETRPDTKWSDIHEK
jgi:hypothetical protein